MTKNEKKKIDNPRCHMAVFGNQDISVLLIAPLQDMNANAVQNMKDAGFEFKTTLMATERINSERLSMLVPNSYGEHENIVEGGKQSIFCPDPRSRESVAKRILALSADPLPGQDLNTVEKLAKLSLKTLEILETELQGLNQ
jgi:hypothetical protein